MKTHWFGIKRSLWQRAAVSGLFGLSFASFSGLAQADDQPGSIGQPSMSASFDDWSIAPGGLQPTAMKAWQPQTTPPPAPSAAPKAEGEGLKDEGKAAPAEAKPDEGEKPWALSDWIWGDSAQSWADAQWKMGGSLAQSWTGNFQSPKDRFNGPVTWTDRSNDYELNQLWFYVERGTDTSKCDWDMGARVDLNYGTNYRWMTSAGFEDTWGMNTSHSFYGLALPQAYVETAYKKLKVKWGHYGSPVGYFVLDTTQNFFNSLPYTYQYGEPFTHWGFLATWTPDDHWAIGSGMTRGWDNLTGAGTGSPNAGYIGTVAYTWDDKSSAAWVVNVSNELADLQGLDTFTTRYFQTFVYTKPINDCWTYVLQSDFGTQSGTTAADGRNIGNALWYGVNQYAFYKQTDKLTWGFNFEWFRDDGGFRVGGVLPTASDPSSQVRGLPLSRFGYDGSFFQVTMGPKWQPHPNVMVRPNLRFDWYHGDVDNPGGLRPYNDGNSNFQAILGTDIAVLF